MRTDLRDGKSSASLHRLARSAVGQLPRETRFKLLRRMVDCDPAPNPRLQLGIAATRTELEACFALLHDAYVGSGFMTPDPSGMRVTPYHALPTTTTLCARFDGEVVGTLSIIREGVFGFPMQAVFDLTEVRAQPGRIAEISALAVRPDFRSTGGKILFPLMKFMYEYCTRYFDTRHLVIAVNPKHIEMYEALLFFRRLQAHEVSSYDFVNGAPAIGATLDLHGAPEVFAAAYEGRPPRKDLYNYFTQITLPNIQFPSRRYHTTNDPVMTPELLDHFFHRRTQVFSRLDNRQRLLLHATYPERDYADVLPPLDAGTVQPMLRQHRRYSLKCPATIRFDAGSPASVELEVIDVSRNGFLARARSDLQRHTEAAVQIELGWSLTVTEHARARRRIRHASGTYIGFQIAAPSRAWIQFIAELEEPDSPTRGAEPSHPGVTPTQPSAAEAESA